MPQAPGFGAAVLVLLLGTLRADAESPTSFPISLVDNRVFVDVEVDGRGPLVFLLDTGSSGSTVNARIAAKLHLPKKGSGGTDGAGEKHVAHDTVHLDSLKLGSMELGPLDAPALDTRELERAIGFTHFDGVLGTEIFQRTVVTIDLAQSLMIVSPSANFRPPSDARQISFTLNEDQMPVVRARINGIEGRFLIDTGDRSSLTLFGPFWRAKGLDRHVGRTTTAMTGYGIGGTIQSIVGRPATFSLGNVSMPAPVTRLSLQKAGVFTSADYAGSIGMGVLKRFVCVFDYSRHILWLQKTTTFNYADRYDRSGTWLGLDGQNRVIVMDLTKGGPAAEAGVQKGDVVLSIDHHSAGAESLSTLRDLLKMPAMIEATFDLQRDGSSQPVRLRLADLISPPSPG